MTNLAIRPAIEADYDRLARIWWHGQTPFDGSPIPPALYDELRERLPREVATGGWSVFTAEDVGRIVALLAIKCGEGVLTQIFIDPDARSRGIGKTLLDLAKQQMPDGFWLRTHSLNVRAHAFYAREGLTHTHSAAHPQHPEAIFRYYAWKPGP